MLRAAAPPPCASTPRAAVRTSLSVPRRAWAAAACALLVGAGCDPVEPVVSFESAQVEVEPALVQFGPVPVSFSSIKEDEVTVRNGGDRSLFLEQVAVVGAAAFRAISPPDEVDARDEEHIALSFTPDVVGPFEAELVLTTNDATNPEQRVTLRGRGCDPNLFGSCDPDATGSSCIQPTEAVWTITGDTYCSTFGLRCTGLTAYNSEDCSGEGYDRTESFGLEACRRSADPQGSFFEGVYYGAQSALWRCEDACPSGYEASAVGFQCADVDECQREIDDCTADQLCVNEAGRYRCVCPRGTETVDGACVAQPVGEAPCLTRFDEDYGPYDFRDGSTDLFSPPLLDLAGTLGGDVCAGFDQVCVGVLTTYDLESLETGVCPSGSSIGDNQGAYLACSSDLASSATSPGFDGADDLAFPARWDCADECPTGAEPARSEDGDLTGFCIDVNECTSRLDNCSDDAECIDSTPGFACCCSTGLVGDGETCVENDINEPLCQNSCQFQLPGFRAPEEDCERIGQTLTGVRVWNSSDCSGDYTDLDGGFFFGAPSFVALCDGGCPAGTEVVGSQCLDVDECLRELDDCGENALCINDPGSFYCVCELGYSGDGYECIPLEEDEPQCAEAGDTAFTATGDEYCALFDRTCTGLALFDDEVCGANIDPSCGGLGPAACCAQSIDAVAGTSQRSGLWTCAVN